jgi:hypothetical protein
MATKVDLEAALRTILPYAQIEEDNDGQLIIYTGLRETDGGELEEID